MADDVANKQQDDGAAAAGAPREPAAYRFGDAVIAVDAGDSETARWLREFLAPWFTSEVAAQSDARVCMVSSTERFAELAAQQADTPTRPVPCFSLDSALVSYPGWSEPGGTVVVADGEYGCYYRVLGSQVEVVARPRDRVARVGLLRVVRELATLRALVVPGMLDLRAAAFVMHGCAVLLVGRKRAGKTSLLAHALGSGQVALLANHRLLVECGSLRAAGVPTVVSVGEDTERRFPALGRGLPRRAALLHAGELVSPEALASVSGARLVLSPGQFAGQLGAATEGSASVGMIVFPEISPDESVWSLHPVGRDEGGVRLCEGLYAGRSGPRERTVFQAVVGEPPAGEAQAELARGLAHAVSLMRCRLGPDAYRGHARAWLRALPLPKGG